MDAHFLRKMLYSADEQVQIGIVVWGNRHDYEMHKDEFEGGAYRYAIENAKDGKISTVCLQQITFSKSKSPLVVPIVHCLTSDAKFSSALKQINEGNYNGPYMFLPSRKLYDF